MSENTMGSIIALSIAAVIMTLILCVFTGCKQTSDRDASQIESCIKAGNEWRPVFTIPNPGRNDWQMSCIRPSRS